MRKIPASNSIIVGTAVCFAVLAARANLRRPRRSRRPASSFPPAPIYVAARVSLAEAAAARDLAGILKRAAVHEAAGRNSGFSACPGCRKARRARSSSDRWIPN